MKELLYLVANVWLMATTWYYGIQMFRDYRNHLLTLEWLVVAVSSTNFLLWALLGADESSPMYNLAYALDAFSRSFGFTLVVVLGLLVVTHRRTAPAWLELGAVGLAVVGGAFLGPLHNNELQYDALSVTIAVFYLVANLLTSGFLLYFAWRVWLTGRHALGVWTAAVTLAGVFVAATYDFFPLGFDDGNRTIFYTIALATWGTQALVYFYGYKALHEYNESVRSHRGNKVRVAQ